MTPLDSAVDSNDLVKIAQELDFAIVTTGGTRELVSSARAGASRSLSLSLALVA